MLKFSYSWIHRSRAQKQLSVVATSMRPWCDLSRIVGDEEGNFAKAPEIQVRLVALLFCRPELSLMKSDILPSLNYFHERSGDHTAFYFAGFPEFLPLPETYEKLRSKLPVWGGNNDGLPFMAVGSTRRVGENDPKAFAGPEGRYWCFMPGDFDRIRRAVEINTRWRYSVAT